MCSAYSSFHYLPSIIIINIICVYRGVDLQGATIYLNPYITSNVPMSGKLYYNLAPDFTNGAVTAYITNQDFFAGSITNEVFFVGSRLVEWNVNTNEVYLLASSQLTWQSADLFNVNGSLNVDWNKNSFDVAVKSPNHNNELFGRLAGSLGYSCHGGYCEHW